jgi:hypothetical protein
MRIISISDLKRSPSKWFGFLKDNERVLIKGKGEDIYELIPAERITEDGVYFANKGVKARLDASIRSAENGDVTELGIDELNAALGIR